tara:strand:+ start:1351 stop:1800 length:450 start_codon:yes stop_codon:yes gene_type:complete
LEADMSELHPSFWAALAGWFLAQFIKMISCFFRSGKLDFSYLLSTGGMPSAHSAMACSLATSVGLYEGLDSVAFTIVAAFAAVVMFDAQSVRKAAGEQAKILNQIVDELLHEHHLSEKKLKELLGHTRLEVLGGLTTGVMSAHICKLLG